MVLNYLHVARVIFYIQHRSSVTRKISVYQFIANKRYFRRAAFITINAINDVIRIIFKRIYALPVVLF